MDYVGIDLGTTNSAIASYDGTEVSLYKSPEQQDVTPSALFFDRRGNRYVGSRAYDNWVRNSDNGATLFKRMMGTSTPIRIAATDATLSPEECSAEILRTVFGYLPEEIRQGGATGTVITVPAAFNQMQKDATLAAAEMAGIGAVALMQEPVAAVMSVMRQRDRDGTFLVFDLGGGTLDIAIAQSMRGRVSLLSHGGIEMCGGRDIDRALMDDVIRPWLMDSFDLGDGFAADPRLKSLIRVSTWAAEKAKIALSRDEHAVISLSEIEVGVRDRTGEEVYLDIPLDRTTLDRLMAPIIANSVTAARDAIDQAGLTPADLDRIVFVGGPTQYKPLRDKVAFELGVAASTDVNPMTAVAEGAAIFAESIDWSTQTRGRKAARASLSGSGIEFAYITRTPDVSAKIVAKNVAEDGTEFQVDSLDTGWSSGRVALTDGTAISLPLPKKGENAFRVFVFSKDGAPIGIPKDRIVISRTAASVDAIPASHTVSIEVLVGRPKTTSLEPLIRKGEALPKKGSTSFLADEAIRAGGANSLNFKLVEGEAKDAQDNLFIGLFRISGQDFDAGVISVGAEVICEYEISDAGAIQLDVSVPSVAGSFSSGQNYYSRQDAQTDYTKAAGTVLREAADTRARIDQLAEHVEDERLQDIRRRVDQAGSIDADSADPEETKAALDAVRAARRDISAVRQDHLKTIRQMDLDAAVEFYGQTAEELSSAEDRQAFENLVRTAQHSIDTDARDFEAHLEELRSRIFLALWKSDAFVIARFQWLARSPELFPDSNKFASLLERGRHALAANDGESLRRVVVEMDDVRFTRSGEEEMLAMSNIVRA